MILMPQRFYSLYEVRNGLFFNGNSFLQNNNIITTSEGIKLINKHLLSEYNNLKSRRERREYLRKYKLELSSLKETV